MPQRRLHFSISIILSTLAIVFILAISIVGNILYIADKSADIEAKQHFNLVGHLIREKTAEEFRPALDYVGLLSALPESSLPIENFGLNHSLFSASGRVFDDYPSIYSLYVGRNDGSFLQVINCRDFNQAILAHQASSETSTILRSITNEGDSRRETWLFLDENGRILESRSNDAEYDPRNRPWFIGAQEARSSYLTDPYEFYSLKQSGITASRTNEDSSCVVGIDLTISRLTDFIINLKFSENGGVALYTSDGDIIASTPGFIDLIPQELITTQIESEDVSLYEDTFIRSERWEATESKNLFIVSAAPRNDFMADAAVMQKRIIFISTILIIVILPFILIWALSISRGLHRLAEDATHIGNMKFDHSVAFKTSILEFWQLANTFKLMKSTISERTNDLQTANTRLKTLAEMIVALSAERNFDRLSEVILKNAKELANADGGSLYLVNETRDALDFSIVLTDSLGIAQGGTSGTPIAMNSVPLYNDGRENHHNVVTHAFFTGKTVNIADAYEIGEYDFSGTRKFDAHNGYRSVSFLTLPLKPMGGGDILGAIQLINATDPETGEIIPFSKEIETFIEALGSAAAVAVHNWRLVKKQKDLFNDLVRFIASAIDKKSPYTARHCERVPQIADILIDAADAAESGPFKNFEFKNPDERREFEIAAWLHDCGKVTTPEYIVDKATKLETIHNRIHEIRTRFEVLLRDARIERLSQILSGVPEELADEILQKQEQKLHEDFAFVAECNIGSERMDDKAIQRLKDIGRTQWTQNFNDHIGLSWVEHQYLSDAGINEENAGLPRKTNLLMDLPEHRIHRPEETKSLYEDQYKKLGIILDIPELLFNRGEIYNLSIRSGTLTKEDRYIINEHVAQTIIMLSEIKFPDELKKVIDYAGEHHENPMGTGYPRGISSTTLSVPSRILAVADIFEALTSADRPYKKDKTLSETLDIMYEMKKKGLIDGEVFTLLIKSKAYETYAEQFLKPEQIDEVNPGKYLI